MSQEIEDVFAPRTVSHHVDRLNQSPPHQTSPQAVHDGSGQTTITGSGRELGGPRQSLSLGCGRIDGTQPRKKELGVHLFAGRLVTAIHLQRFSGNDGGHAIGVLQLPIIDKAVMAGSALHVLAKEDLRHILGKLNFSDLRGIHIPPPLNSLDESLGFFGRIQELTHKLVIGLVRFQRVIQPPGDLASPPVNKPGPGIVVPKKIIPESHPVIRVINLPRQ